MSMTDSMLYRKRGVVPMKPWKSGMDMTGVSISPDDDANGSPKAGDMVAHDADNPNDRWLVNKDYFQKHYEPAGR